MTRNEEICGLVLVAGGTSQRFGGSTPKQFMEVDGVPVFRHSLEQFISFIDGAVIVVPSGWESHVEGLIDDLHLPLGIRITSGGPNRQESVRLGLLRLGQEMESVLVHDAARPYVSSSLISRVLDGVRLHGACVPVLPVQDTVKLVEKQWIVRTLPREEIGLAQTPQGFRMSILSAAYEDAGRTGFLGTDEASLVERIGIPIFTVAGEASNTKLTYRVDLDLPE